MKEITMIPIGQLVHHPENLRLDLGDLTELTASIKANGIMQNLTVVFEPGHEMTPAEWAKLSEEYDRTQSDELKYAMSAKWTPDRYLVVIGNRRLEASKAAGLTELPCVISDMDRKTQMATMLQENMQRSDLTLYEQARGIQMMMDLGFTKEQISEKTGFSRTTIDRRLAVAALPKKETKAAVSMGYDLMDLVEISKIEDRDAQEDLLKGTPKLDAESGTVDRTWLRQRIANVKRDTERKRQEARLLPDVKAFAKPFPGDAGQRWNGNKWHHTSFDVQLDSSAVVKAPKDPGNYYYLVNFGTIEIWEKLKQEKHVKSDREIAMEKKRCGAKELNDRMRENRLSFVSSYQPTKAQEEKLRAKMLEYVFCWKNRYNDGDFFASYHSWNIAKFRDFCGMTREDDRETGESLAEEIKRRGIPMGRAILAWMLCGGVKCDDRQGYANEYNGLYSEDRDLDDVYTILTDAGYTLTEEEQSWKNGTHEFFREEGAV